jgi:hypothetical protein
MKPYDRYIFNDDGTKKCDKVYLLYIDGDAKLCDGCDKNKTKVASISVIGNNVMCICKDCLQDIINEF